MKVIEIVESTGLDTQSMAQQILAFAEEHAYDQGAESGSMNDDSILQMAQQALSEIESIITQQIEGGRQQDQGAEIEHQMGADRNMERGETNFNDPDSF